MQRFLGIIFMAIVAGSPCATAPASAATAPQEPADLIVHNAKITTLEQALPEAQALAVRGETLVAVGQEEQVMMFRGDQAAAHAPPLRAILRAGIPVGAGTDATRVSSHNPWLSLYWMVTGKTVGGTRLASEENRLSRDEALRLYTVGSAWLSGDVVYAAEPFVEFAPEQMPAVSPAWSPVAVFGGYQQSSQTGQ